MCKKRILVVDDERDLCDILVFNLTTAGYEAEAVCSATEAMDVIARCQSEHAAPFDLLLVDVMMPGMSGFELAGKLKTDEATSHLPIIFLTARDSEDDMLHGFGLGADDYVTKPFSVREVLARIRAVLSRSQQVHVQQEPALAEQPAPTGSLFSFEGLVVDNIRKTVVTDADEVALTKTEFELLLLLLSHRGQVLSRQQLIEGAWPADVVVSDRAVDVNITRLRKKLGRYADHIITRQGFGYVFE